MRETHELKIISVYFGAVKDGRKTFEVRKNDRDYKVGDILLLEEIFGTGDVYNSKTRDSIEVVITYIYSGELCKEGYVILGIKKV